jgi:hypothetical protein
MRLFGDRRRRLSGTPLHGFRGSAGGRDVRGLFAADEGQYREER